jgi:SAM-dependent methyltransferase
MGSAGLSSNLWAILACPHCGSHLTKTDLGHALCSACDIEYAGVDESALDLRLRKPKQHSLSFELAERAPEPSLLFEPLEPNPDPEVSFSGIETPWHLTPALLSYFPKASNPESLVLDLGCGEGIHRTVCEHAGFEYVGLDYSGPRAPLRGDAHALPFLDDCFEFVLSIAVLEHIRYPFVMMSEVHRVLKPGGRLIGTVAFLEPFHDQSLYHHSHLGTLNTLQFANFQIDRIAPSEEWSVLTAQGLMGGLPHLKRRRAELFMRVPIVILKLLQRLGVMLGKRFDKNAYITRNTGAFTFLATKKG